jgi:hypothetical protein
MIEARALLAQGMQKVTTLFASSPRFLKKASVELSPIDPSPFSSAFYP